VDVFVPDEDAGGGVHIGGFLTASLALVAGWRKSLRFFWQALTCARGMM
jgi:hypothetical protein